MNLSQEILIVGSLAFDVIFSIPQDFRKSIPVENGRVRSFNASFIADEKKEFPGGTAGNIAFWLGVKNVPSTIFSAWGKDFTEKGYRKKLENLGVKIRGSEGDFTAHAYMISDPLHQQLIIWQPNAYKKNEAHRLSDYFSEQELQRFSFALFGAGNPSSCEHHLSEFRKYNKQATVIFDPGQITPFLSARAFRKCAAAADILIGNDIEFQYFRKHGIASHLMTIETRGSRDVLVTEHGKTRQFLVKKVRKVVETTGAGDAFRGGFLAGMAQGKSLTAATKTGIELGAKCVTLPSAQF